MSLTVNIYYSGKNGNAKKFAEEMTTTGVVEAIQKEEGNLKYEYFIPLEDDETILLVDSWRDQQSLDVHHDSPMMQEILDLREKYDLTMKVERYFSDDDIPDEDQKYIRK